MTIRSANSYNLQAYPKIQIDRGSVIKPCIAEQSAADQFIDRTIPTWRRIVHDIWHEGLPYILKYVSNAREPRSANPYYVYFIRTIRYLALLLLHLHQVYLYIYGYFYPYSLMSLDELCNEFTRCPKWTESVIRAFSWHPNFDRCAVAICNDYVYVYHGTSRIRVLRHNSQRKIVDMAWHPTNEQVLIVATQTNILVWRIAENSVTNSRLLDNSQSYAYLAPGVHLIRRGQSSQIDPPNLSESSHENSFRILDNFLSPPIVSLQFDQKGDKLLACSPNSSKIAVIGVKELLESKPDTKGRIKIKVNYLRKFGQGVTKLLWSPTKNRLAVATTSSFIRVHELFAWTSRRWLTQDIAQDLVWSKPSGRILLIANKTEPYLYALPFLDEPQANDVGGNRSITKALDLTATRGELGTLVGGCVQSLAWDREGKRLAISFRDNPESILLYRTVEKPTVEFHQLGIIQSDNGSLPLLMDFHDKFKNGSLLTICWSDGNCQHIPLTYASHEQLRNVSSKANGHDSSLNSSHVNPVSPNSGAKTARSLTNFCHVSGSNSISPYQAALMPINKLQHHKTLFTLEK